MLDDKLKDQLTTYLEKVTRPVELVASLDDGEASHRLAALRGVMAVPAVFLNGEPFDQGRMALEQIVGRLDTGSADWLRAREPFDVLMVGGGPAGAAAAVYAARKGIRTGVAAERFGGQVLDTLAIENLVSVPATEGPRLAATLEAHVRQYDVDVMNLQQAQALVPAAEAGGVHEVRFAGGGSLRAEYQNRGVAYCPHCDGPLFRGKRVAVIGGGNSGVEAAIDLAGIAGHVAVLEFDPKLRADAVLQERLVALPNVQVVTSARTTEIHGDGERVTGLSYVDRAVDRADDKPHHVPLEGVFVQIGLVPNSEWLRGTLALSEREEIEVDAHGATSAPGVFAAGDVSTARFKQIVTAMGDGANAALSAFEYLIRAPRSGCYPAPAPGSDSRQLNASSISLPKSTRSRALAADSSSALNG